MGSIYKDKTVEGKWVTPLIADKSQLAAVIFGLMLALSFAPVGIAPLAVFAIMALFWLVHQASNGTQALKRAFWFGVGLFGTGVSWVYSSVLITTSSWPIAIGMAVFFVLFLSLFLLAFAWLAWRLKHPSLTLFNYTLLFPLLYVVLEIVRLTVLNGFPYLVLGYSQLHTALAGYAPILGVLGVSWLLAVSAGLLLNFMQERAYVSSSILLFIIWIGGTALLHVEWVQPKGDPVDVALVQGNVPQAEKWKPEHLFPTIKGYQGLINDHMLKADVIVLPETALPTYWSQAEPTFGKIRRNAELTNTSVLIGVPTRTGDSGGYYNSVIDLTTDQRYHKVHLVPFGEMTPLPWLFKPIAALLQMPRSDFQIPTLFPTMTVNEHQVAMSICYEIAFGDEMAQRFELAPQQQVDYFITVSNDAWFDQTLEPKQHLQMAQFRALELGRELARATNTGATAIVDIRGEIKDDLPMYDSGVLVGKVQPYTGMTWYARYQDSTIYAILLILLAGFAGMRLAHGFKE